MFLVIEVENNQVLEVTHKSNAVDAAALAIEKVRGHGCDPDNDEGEFHACMDEDGTYECEDGWRITVWELESK